MPDCCKPQNNKGSVKQGILFGLIPHVGCIAFIVASIVGATFFTELFKPLLMNRYFFYGLIAVSILFATISIAWYLKTNKMLSVDGAKRKWKYISLMYITTIGINLLFFMVIFPMVANIEPINFTGTSTQGTQTASGLNTTNQNLTVGQSATTATFKISVEIPCSGHASLISGELKKVSGVSKVTFGMPNQFTVTYDTTKTTQEQILGISVFKEYPAKIIN